jgi:Ca2+-transporting ATPase
MHNPYPFRGLSEKEAGDSLKKYGSNEIASDSGWLFWQEVKEIISDPMLILLAVAAIIYFVSGEISDALFMSGAIIFIAAISVYQSGRSHRALRALREFTQSKSLVIRDNQPVYIPIGDIVTGDYAVVSEGELIPADGTIKQLNDFSVNESILTGEAYSVTKDIHSTENNRIYRGTLVESGQCVFEVTAVGIQTKFEH